LSDLENMTGPILTGGSPHRTLTNSNHTRHGSPSGRDVFLGSATPHPTEGGGASAFPHSCPHDLTYRTTQCGRHGSTIILGERTVL